MVKFERFVLENGLKVLVHEDEATPMAAVNILYNVGARDELEDKTGFAHLFEHLMFEGSENAPNFDEPLQRAGGESNAFTNNDVTNYYDLVPADNLELVFWLESDRMRALKIDEHSLEIQRKVVCEEFKEHYLNQPYGDIWHKLSALSYKTHPYKWPTIGLELSHIENATLEDVKDFFTRYYVPNNAIMIVGGNVKLEEVKKLAEKWFGQIPGKNLPKKHIPKEKKQQQPRHLDVHADVPVDALYKAYHMGNRDSRNYYIMDIVSDMLAEGHSSRFYQSLVKDKKLFSQIDTYITGTFDEGLIIVEGRLAEGVGMDQANEAIEKELDMLSDQPLSDYELLKVKNKQESYHTFSEVNLLNRVIHLAYYELLGDASKINTDLLNYESITIEEVLEESKKVFRPDNCSTIYYYSKN